MKKLFHIILALMFSVPALAQTESGGKISGYMYLDYYYNVARDAGNAALSDAALQGDKDLNGLSFRRIYFTYDYKMSNTFSTRFRLEGNDEETTKGKIGVIVKDAYLKWDNILHGHDFLIGIQPTPAFQISEEYWGYRSIEKTILDLRQYVSSRDFSLSLKGKLDQDGLLNYYVMFGNNSGNKPEVDKYKRYYAHLNIKPVDNVDVTIYGDFKSKGGIDDPNIQAGSPPRLISNNDITTALFVGYKEENEFSVGAEGVYSIEQNGIQLIKGTTTEVKNKIGIALSLFGSYFISEYFALFGRYDYFDPNTNSAFDGDSRNYFIGGLDYRPDSKVSIIPNILIETYENLPIGRKVDASVTGRVTFYYKFL